MIEILAFAGVIMAVFVPMGIRFEHRITRVEDKLDSLLDHNGIDPSECSSKKKPKKK